MDFLLLFSFLLSLLLYHMLSYCILEHNSAVHDLLDFSKLKPGEQSFLSILFAISTFAIAIFLSLLGFLGFHSNKDTTYKVTVKKDGSEKEEKYTATVKNQ